MKVVQIGTNNGNDDVNKFCLMNSPSFILLVEPFDIHLESIKKQYNTIIDNIVIENIAIHYDSNVKEVDLYYTDLDGPQKGPGCSFEVASIVPNHLIKHNYPSESLKKVSVKSSSLNNLFDKYNLDEIDYLFLDIEGIDFEVLQSIDFNKYNIKNLQIEHLHLDRNELMSFMTSRGYQTGFSIDSRGFDTMFKKYN